MNFSKNLAVSATLGVLTTLLIVGPTVADIPDNLTSATLPSQTQLQTTPPSVQPFYYLPAPPVAQVTPADGTFSIRLINTIGAPITYEVVTDTEQRSLPANSDVVLQNLSLPVSIFIYRPDTGLIQPTAATRPGQLELTLEATTDFADNVRSIELDSSGYVFLE
ncbi:MAG: hypothetical protein ACFB5Z_10150 [Elainellaceae cyanobacterium]